MRTLAPIELVVFCPFCDRTARDAAGQPVKTRDREARQVPCVRPDCLETR